MNKIILQAHQLFETAGFDYAICGGFALDMFAGRQLRPHGDFDIVIFKENKKDAVRFLQANGWPVYGRFMEEGKNATQLLFYLIDNPADSKWDYCENMWAVKPGSFAEMYPIERAGADVYSYKIHEPRLQGFDFIELAFDGRDDNDFILQDNPKVTLPLDKAILYKDSIPYLVPEAVLFYKTDKFSSEHPYLKPKTEADFKAIMPLLSCEQRTWLINAVKIAYPDGAPWLDGLIL